MRSVTSRWSARGGSRTTRRRRPRASLRSTPPPIPRSPRRSRSTRTSPRTRSRPATRYPASTSTLLYAKVGTGYRAGGVNNGTFNAAAPNPFVFTYDNENTIGYEAGVKASVTSEHLRAPVRLSIAHHRCDHQPQRRLHCRPMSAAPRSSSSTSMAARSMRTASKLRWTRGSASARACSRSVSARPRRERISLKYPPA